MTSKGNHINWDSSLRNTYQTIQIIFLNFKTALYSSASVVRLSESGNY